MRKNARDASPTKGEKCLVYCEHAYVDKRGKWRCALESRTYKPDIYTLEGKICRNYAERPQLGVKIRNACVASCAATLDAQISALVNIAVKKAKQECSRINK